MVQVAVYDELPIFRQGLLCALGLGGTDLASVGDVSSWLAGRTDGLLLLSVNVDQDEEVLDLLRAHSGASIVAVMPSTSSAAIVRVLRAGAAHYVSRDASAPRYRQVVEETMAGSVTTTINVLRAVVAPTATRFRSRRLPNDYELEWLRQLKLGSPVSAIAANAGYSERMMFRKLRDLYTRLEAKTRTEALMLAQEAGWL